MRSCRPVALAGLFLMVLAGLDQVKTDCWPAENVRERALPDFSCCLEINVPRDIKG